MHKLSDIILNIDILEIKGNTDIEISSIYLNSNLVKEGGLFVAVVGNVVDGHNYITQAIENGAKAIIYENDLNDYKEGIVYLKVNDSHDAVARVAVSFYDNPSSRLKLVGTTGTNGKTTITTLLYQLFTKLGYKVGMIGTTGTIIGTEKIEGVRTTPDAISLNMILAEMVEKGCEYCFMEVSSHSVCEKRIVGIDFKGGVFTNLTHDHLDYHGTLENYKDAKKGFFDMLPLDSFALVNIDDQSGYYMLTETQAKKYTYSLKEEADFTEHLETRLIGEFNMYNTLAVYATAVLLNEDRGRVREIMKELLPAEGRFDYFKNKNNITAIVDYAHSPDAIKNVLDTINKLRGGNKNKIITVVGAGGDRDRLKRPIMAGIGYAFSDILILTSDNPRSESPESIIDDMKKGIETLPQDKVHVFVDRHQAISNACSFAEEGDYVVVLGKGHEKYQEVKGVQTHFDDMEELKKHLL